MEQTSPHLRTQRFEVASPSDYDQIFALNYATFVEEIPQHLPNPSRRLVDRFHGENTYVGVVSGTTRELRLYRHMGFVPFGPEVGAAGARYQPMYVTMATFEEETAAAFRRCNRSKERRAVGRCPTPISFLPGPVAIGPAVQNALALPAGSHRSQSFLRQLRDVRRGLRELTGARCAALMVGSGTLANDVVAGQIWKTETPGVVVSDGEFGRRLVDHAERWSLRASVFERPWGAAWSHQELAEFMDLRPGTKWLWAALCETSTGALRDLEGLRSMCAERGVDLYLDAVSAVGAVPVDLCGVRMASAVSGKALGSYPGLAVVLHQGLSTEECPSLPRDLDLALYEASDGVPFTQSSNLVGALQAAMVRYRTKGSFDESAALALHLRTELRRMGFRTVVPDAAASPAVTTLALPAAMSPRVLGDRLGEAGLLVSYESEYLLERNWLQICLMGSPTRAGVDKLLGALASIWVIACSSSVRPRSPGAAGSALRY